MKMKRVLRPRLVLAALIALVVLLLVLIGRQAAPRRYVVEGPSMQPYLQDGDILLYSKYSEPGYGDIIVFHSAAVDGRLLVKRVIGREGDTIALDENGIVYRNGQPLDESGYAVYTQLPVPTGEVTVQAGCLFVMGDNRSVSVDSRDERVGQVALDDVSGRVTWVVRNVTE